MKQADGNEGLDQAVHERLCAYVLGEGDAAERARVEELLAGSSALRDERVRLERTIGVVRGALSENEALSVHSSRALTSAARSGRIASFPWLRAAAAIAAVGLGAWIFRPFGGRVDQEVAVGRSSERNTVADARNDASGSSLGIPPATAEPVAMVPRTEDRDAETRKEMIASRSGAEPWGGLTPLEAKAKESAPPASPSAAKAGRVATKGDRSESIFGGGKLAPSARPVAQNRSGPGTAGPSSPMPRGPVPQSVELQAGQAQSAGASMPGLAREAPSQEMAKLQGLGYTAHDNDFFAGQGAASERERQQVPDARTWWSNLSPAERELALERESQRLLYHCRPYPDERPRDMFFRFWGDNAFEVALLDSMSTFAADVDTASYALARRYLQEGKLPEKAQIRTEEFVNYFPSDVAAPRDGTFAIHTDLTPSRFSDSQRALLRVVVRGKDVDKFERQPLALTFVLDVSGSMREQNRLGTVKDSLRLLVTQLLPGDSIAIVTFSSDAKIVLPMTPVADRAAIELALAPLEPQGGTNSNAGLQLGYAVALQGLDRNATNRVVFLSDGVANVGETDAAKIVEGVKSIREKGIYLNTIGVGMNNHNDALLEQLANKGDGMCHYIDSQKEAKRVLVDQFTGAFQPIARDVKLQVQFDPTQVLRYRLLGYENRAIADQDFRNDAVDAGELGAGHQVTALYEIERTNQPSEAPLATVRVRWKSPRTFGLAAEEDRATEIEHKVSVASQTSFEGAPLAHRRAAVVAQFAEFLRRSIHARADSFDDLLAEAKKVQMQLGANAEWDEFVSLLETSKHMIARLRPASDELAQTLDLVRENAYLRAQATQLAREQSGELLATLAQQNAALEAQIRELLRRKLEAGEALPPDAEGR